MKKNPYLLNTLLAAAMFAVLAVETVVRATAPAVILPRMNIPNMVLISLVCLLLDSRMAPDARRCWICIPVLSAVSFGLLPLMAGVACIHNFWQLGLIGGAVFTVTTWAFTSVRSRIASGEAGGAALVMTALGMYLAAQCFAGILL